ncbi:MAG: cupredoxin domain-containing protein [Dehalococcoidia bacterium]|nr:cupredoxin domain-containing protein [Dehalococcoidia bacterium]MDW8008525.1 cupredoxin domain-containing protein [Chloroflexota bacterium]
MRLDITKLPMDLLVLGGLAMAVMATFLIAFALTVGEGGGGETAAEGGQGPAGPPVTAAEIRAVRSIRFNTNQLVIAAGQDVTIHFINEDTGQVHDFTVWRDRTASERLAGTRTCTAPCDETISVNLPAGRYFFNCTVHPQQMTGTLFVQ